MRGLLTGDHIKSSLSLERNKRMRRRWRSRLNSVLLLSAMAALLAYCGWVVAGGPGILWSLGASFAALIVLRHMPPSFLLRALKAQPLPRAQAPPLYRILDDLCQDAEIKSLPLLCRVPGPGPAAFTMWNADTAAIVLSQSVIDTMSARELRGILAHEVIHLKNGDLALMQLAVVVGRMTRVLPQVAFLLLFMALLLNTVAARSFPLLPLMVLAVAPLGVNLLQFALSRTREAEADLEAAELTGDPLGLAFALIKMRDQERTSLQRRYPGTILIPVPPLFRDHPATEERIQRLLRMAPPTKWPPEMTRGEFESDDTRPWR
jgi:heat shock protein HtpX